MMRSSDDPGETDAGILAPHTTQGRRGLGFRGLGSSGVWFRVWGSVRGSSGVGRPGLALNPKR